MITLSLSPTIAPLLDRWERFSRALSPDRIDLLQTEDVVAGLLDRSMLQQDLDAGVVLAPDDLARLDNADRALRAAAPTLLEQTEIALYRDDEPVSHWWWHLEQLVLGSASELLLNVPEAAAAKGVHPHTVRAAIREGLLPARRLARGFLVHRRDLERWEPRRAGRPSRASAPTGTGDVLLDGFNAATTSREFERAAQIAASIARDPSTPRRKLALALDAFNREDYPSALRWAEDALRGELPDRSRQTAGLVRGRALLAMGELKRARKALREVEAVGPMDGVILAAIADVELELGRTAQAVEAALAARACSPGQPEFTYQLARMEWHADQVTAALEHVTEFRTIVPDHQAASLLHGAILGLLGDRTNDSRCYLRAMDTVAPWREAYPEAAAIHGMALSRLGRFSEAMEVLRAAASAAEDDPSWEHLLSHLGPVLADAIVDGKARPDRLLDRLERIVGAGDTVGEARARAAARTGDLDRCVSLLHADLSEPTTIDPADRAVVLLAGLRARRAEAVASLARLVVDDKTTSASATQVAVSVALAADDLATAKRGLESLANEPTFAGLLAETALAALAAGERHGRDAISGAVIAEIFDRWTTTDAPRPGPAVASEWEGQHTTMGSVVDEMLRLAQ